MEKGIDKLTGELAKLADQLSKAIPKGYAELVKEYAFDHGVAAIGNGLLALLTIALLAVVVCIEIKYLAKFATRLAKHSEDFYFVYNLTYVLCLIITGVFVSIAVCIIFGYIKACVYEIRHMIAPNYYMLKTIIGK